MLIILFLTFSSLRMTLNSKQTPRWVKREAADEKEKKLFMLVPWPSTFFLLFEQGATFSFYTGLHNFGPGPMENTELKNMMAISTCSTHLNGCSLMSFKATPRRPTYGLMAVVLIFSTLPLISKLLFSHPPNVITTNLLKHGNAMSFKLKMSLEIIN